MAIGLYYTGFALIIPGTLLSLWFAFWGAAASQRSWGGLLRMLFSLLEFSISPWLVICLAGIVAIAAFGIFAQTRAFGAATLACLGGVEIVFMVGSAGFPRPSELAILLLTVAGVMMNTYVALRSGFRW